MIWQVWWTHVTSSAGFTLWASGTGQSRGGPGDSPAYQHKVHEYSQWMLVPKGMYITWLIVLQIHRSLFYIDKRYILLRFEMCFYNLNLTDVMLEKIRQPSNGNQKDFEKSLFHAISVKTATHHQSSCCTNLGISQSLEATQEYVLTCSHHSHLPLT